jgi:hypothetical protein
VLRAAARRLMPSRPDVITAVFGSPRRASPWHWGPVTDIDDGQTVPTVTARARVSLDPRTGTARPRHIVISEEITWPSATAMFAIDRFDALPTGFDETTHLTVLACAAAGVHEIGAGRTRGLGWVSCTTADPSMDETTLLRLEQLLAEQTVSGATATRAAE